MRFVFGMSPLHPDTREKCQKWCYQGPMIEITENISIEENEIEESFIRASGPGGQNVNKVSSAVQLKFNIRNSPSLPNDVKARAERLAGRRLTSEGIIVIQARRFRTQIQNREDAQRRLVELLQKATEVPRVRKKSRPSLSAKRKRMDDKSKRGKTKRLRSGRIEE